MRFDELGLPDELIRFLDARGYKELYPPQEQAVKAGLLEGEDLVVSSPTACYDCETEVLTKEGWKSFRDTTPNEEVLSMNPATFEMEYVVARGKIEYSYSGIVVHVSGKEIDFRVTGNHNMFVCRADERKARVGSHSRPLRRSPREFQFMPAIDIHRNWKFKSDGIWFGSPMDFFELPEMELQGRHPSQSRIISAVKIPMSSWLDFLGWYMAEGCTSYGGNRYEVTLCQRKNPIAARNALANLSLGRVYATGAENHQHFSVFSPQLALYLSRFGTALEKFVPEFVKVLPPEDIRVFLDSYRKGDGHIAKDGVSPVFNTTSPRLADDIQELLLKAGRSSSIRNEGVPAPHAMPDGHTIQPRHPVYEVAGRRHSEHGIDYRKPSKPRFEWVEGEMVYCLTLPKYHLLYVRRNGKAFWCGNSGKTLIAMLAAYNCVKKRGRKMVYLSPLRALASEKYSEFKELEALGIRSVISTGDFDASGESLGQYDIILLTNEKFDSILRHGVTWLSRVGLFVSDEVHLAGSGDRGPTLEMILTKVVHMGLDAQLVSLSATISNADQISTWLGSKLVRTNWRPVPLREAVYDYGRLVFADGEARPIDQSSYGAPIDIAMDSVKTGGQALIFAGTRRRAVSLATKASQVTKRFLAPAEKDQCVEAAGKIRSSGEETGLSRLLADMVEKGAAFHHAGLNYEHRRIVEDYFRARAIKLLASTPTLAAGVNLPARRVIVADLTRYDGQLGMNSAISVLDYRQMAGRAGRPQYDDYGETVMVPSSTLSPPEVLEHYALGEVEPIESKLGEERGMRVHLLAAIASSLGITRPDLDGLFSKTLLAAQVGKERVERAMDHALGYLISERLVTEKAALIHATDFGRRVSTLYIDPVTGVLFRDSIRHTESVGLKTVGLLHLVAKSPDFEPKFPLREKNYETAYHFLEEHFSELIHAPNRRSFLEYDEILQDMRTVLAIHYWIEEWREDELLEKLGIEPGDMHRAVDSADWLLYSLGEIAKLDNKQLTREIEFLRKRVNNGVKGELVDLTSLPGIGRVRARSLFGAGFRSIKGMREATVERLAQVEKIGPTLAKKLKDETARR